MYMGRNTFQAILSNLQVLDKSLDLPHNHILHDPLFKVCPMLDMMDRNFTKSYKCGRDLSFDQGCCPYKGRVSFWCYNPAKPSKWHLKLFEVSDAQTGYVIAFDVVTVTVYFPSSRIDHFTPLMILHSIQSNSAACSNSMNCNCPLI